MIKTNQIWELEGDRLIVSIVTKTMTSCYNCTAKIWVNISKETLLQGLMMDLDQIMKAKQYIYCPECQTKHSLEIWMKSWSGLKCDSCGNYIVINEQLHFTEKLEAQNV